MHIQTDRRKPFQEHKGKGAVFLKNDNRKLKKIDRNRQRIG